MLDGVVAALIDDLDQRGMLDTTLVLMLGEFGRTPMISTLSGQVTAGRDHWSSAMSVLVAGCGTPRGQVVGAYGSPRLRSDRKALRARELRVDRLYQARHQPGEDSLCKQWPAIPPGERSSADSGVAAVRKQQRRAEPREGPVSVAGNPAPYGARLAD